VHELLLFKREQGPVKVKENGIQSCCGHSPMIRRITMSVNK
jgi:hypothetical protein